MEAESTPGTDWQAAEAARAREAAETRAQLMRRAFRLVPTDTASRETIACLKALLAEAERGELIGVAWVSMYKNRRWDRWACGEAHRNSTWTLGMLHAYAAMLADEINKG